MLTGLQFGLFSCVAEPYVGTEVYYGRHSDPWFHDDPWMDGPRWSRQEHIGTSVGIYIHPPRHRR